MLRHFYTTKDAPAYGNSSKIALCNASFSLMLLFTLYKTTWLTAISSHSLAALLATDVCAVLSDGRHLNLLNCVMRNC